VGGGGERWLLIIDSHIEEYLLKLSNTERTGKI
jgi:hypothetical protein